MYLRFDNGFLFKDFIEFVSTAANGQLCWLNFGVDGLRVSHEAECDDEKCPTKWYVAAELRAAGFADYSLEKALRVNVDPKKIVKLCRNVKKKDVIELTFESDDEPAAFVMTFRNDVKVERKVVPHVAHVVDSPEPASLTVPEDMFSCDSVRIAAAEISNLKKAVGNKKESISMEFIRGCAGAALVFSAYSQFLSPLRITYNSQAIPADGAASERTRVVVSGTVLNVISKMTSLSKEIDLYSLSKKYENLAVDNGWLRASCAMPHGRVVIYVMAKLK